MKNLLLFLILLISSSIVAQTSTGRSYLNPKTFQVDGKIRLEADAFVVDTPLDARTVTLNVKTDGPKSIQINSDIIFNSPVTSTAGSGGDVTWNGLVVSGTVTANAFNWVPQGTVAIWISTTPTLPPPGWKYCDGDSGAPDMRDKFIIGLNQGNSLMNSITKTGGASIIVHQPGSVTSDNANPNVSGLPSPLATRVFHGTGAGVASLFGVDYTQVNLHTHTINHSHNITFNNADGDVRPPYLTLTYIIKK